MSDPENQTTQHENAARLAPRESSTVAATPPGATPSSSAKPPLDRVGNYRLVRPLGRGGMGEVWLAEHVENPSLQCAVKFIRPDQRNPGLAARFERERESLVRLRHEHIVKVHDLGITDNGLPYLVMEYVAGQPLDAFCDARRLGLNQRLELFLQVCRAVQHAHRQGLIHRDLKPANILVTEIEEQGRARPVAKVIDFGIARALEAPEPPPTDLAAPLDAHLTQTGAFIGSVLYASPEQLLGQPADTRADVYALGKILYQLLSGTLPVTPEELKTMLSEARQQVWQRLASTEIPRPSAKLRTLTDTAPEKLAEWAAARGLRPREFPQLLTRELDWIALRALAGEPDHRYPSVEAFAADVERYLRDEVIEARPPEWPYRLGKFWRRHRAPLTTAAIIVASLVTALAVSVRYERKATAEAKRANEEKARAETEKQRAETEQRRAETLAASEADQRRVADEQRVLAEAQQKRAESNAAEARENLTQAEAARNAQREQLRRASRLDHVTAEQLFAEDRWPQAVAYLAHALDIDPENTIAGIHLWQAIGCDCNPVDHLPDAGFPLPEDATTFAFSQDGDVLAAATASGRVDLFDVLTGRKRGRSVEIGVSISWMRFSRRSRWIAIHTKGEPGDVRVMDSSVQALLPLRGPDVNAPEQLRFSPDESMLVAHEQLLAQSPADGSPWPPARLHRWHLPSAKPIGSHVTLPDGITELEWLDDNKTMSAWSESLGLYAIDAIAGRIRRVVTPPLQKPCAFRSDGIVAAADESAKSVFVCDARSGKLLARLPETGSNRTESLHWRIDDGALVRVSHNKSDWGADVIYPPTSVRAERAKGERSNHLYAYSVYEPRLSPDGTWECADLEEMHAIQKGLGMVWIPLLARHVDVWLQLPGEKSPEWCVTADGRRLSIIANGSILCTWQVHDLPGPKFPMASEEPNGPEPQPVSPDGRWNAEYVGFGWLRIRETSTMRWVTNRVFWGAEMPMPTWHASGTKLLFESADLTSDGQLVLKKPNPTIFEWPFAIPQRGEPWLKDLANAACAFAVQDTGDLAPVAMRDRLAARERLRALKLDGADADVKDPAWARLLKWWLTPYPDRPPFP